MLTLSVSPNRATLIPAIVIPFINQRTHTSLANVFTFSLYLIKALIRCEWWQNCLWLKWAPTEVAMFGGRAERESSSSGPWWVIFKSVIYSIANNLICWANRAIVISHLKQFIRCLGGFFVFCFFGVRGKITHGGCACFMKNPSCGMSRLGREQRWGGIQVCWTDRAEWDNPYFDMKSSGHGAIVRCACVAF